MMVRICLAAILCLFSAVAQNSPPDAAPVLTLERALAEAQQNNRQIKISNQNVLFANDQILAAKTQRYPQFSAQLTASGLLTAVHVDFPPGTIGAGNT
ncbi:MAG: TolC family protein, partial [Candidatus Acidiferrales bacterium]